MNSTWFFRCFCTLLFAGGAFFALVLPAFQVPDEVAHYTRAFELSRGHCFPTDVISMPAGYRADYDLFHPQLEADPLVTNGRLFAEELAHLRVFDARPLETFAPIHSEDVYPCPLYLPGATALAIVRPFHPSIIVSLYFARLFTLLLCGSLIVWGFRIMPFGKELYAFIALLPMQLEQLAALSTDPVVNSIAFFSTAFLLRTIVRGATSVLSARTVGAILGLSVAIGFAKIDILILFLLFLIPESKFRNQFARYSLIVASFVIAGTLVAIGPKFSTVSSTAFVAYRASQDIRPGPNFAFVVHHAGAMLSDLFYTLRILGRDLLAETVGTFGWLSFELPAPFVDFAVVVFVVLGYRTSIPRRFAATIKRFSLAMSVVAFFAAFFALFVTNEPYRDIEPLANGQNLIVGMQGRYFLSFLAFPGLAISGAGARDREVDRFLCVFAALLLGLASVSTIVFSYYLTR